jgi:hypothetical protein
MAVRGGQIGALPSLAPASGVPGGFSQLASAVGQYPQIAAATQLQQSNTEEEQAKLDDEKIQRIAAAVQQNSALMNNPQIQAELRSIQGRRHMSQQTPRGQQPQQIDPASMIGRPIIHASELPSADYQHLQSLDPEQRKSEVQSRGIVGLSPTFLTDPRQLSAPERDNIRTRLSQQLEVVGEGHMTVDQWSAFLDGYKKDLTDALGADGYNALVNDKGIIGKLASKASADFRNIMAQAGKADKQTDLIARNIENATTIDAINKQKLKEMPTLLHDKGLEAQAKMTVSSASMQRAQTSMDTYQNGNWRERTKAQAIAKTNFNPLIVDYQNKAKYYQTLITGMVNNGEDPTGGGEPGAPNYIDMRDEAQANASQLMAQAQRVLSPEYSAGIAAERANGVTAGSGISVQSPQKDLPNSTTVSALSKYITEQIKSGKMTREQAKEALNQPSNRFTPADAQAVMQANRL